MTNEKFENWWFNRFGEQESFDEFGDKITEEDIKRQPSYPCRENAITEAVWEMALIKWNRER